MLVQQNGSNEARNVLDNGAAGDLGGYCLCWMAAGDNGRLWKLHGLQVRFLQCKRLLEMQKFEGR